MFDWLFTHFLGYETFLWGELLLLVGSFAAAYFFGFLQAMFTPPEQNLERWALAWLIVVVMVVLMLFTG